MATPLARPKSRYLVAEVLDAEAARAVKAFHLEGESANTRRAYAQAYRYWGAWYALRYGAPLKLPVPAPVVAQFVVDHLRHGGGGRLRHLLPGDVDRALVQFGYKQRSGALSLSTVEARIAALSSAHRRRSRDGAPAQNPVQTEAVRQLLASVRRAYSRRGEAVRKAPAATREPLEAMLACCDGTLLGLRDRALLLFGFASGGRRRSEITAATFATIAKTGDGYIYTLRHSKTNRTGRADPNSAKPIVGVAAEAVAAWLDALEAAGVRSGPVFRRLTNGVIGDGLSPASVRDIVIRRARLAGLPAGYAAHSLRSGFVTEAARQQVSLPETMALTGHKSVATVLQYFQPGAVSTGRAATLIGSGLPSRHAEVPSRRRAKG
jgi:integrase